MSFFFVTWIFRRLYDDTSLTESSLQTSHILFSLYSKFLIAPDLFLLLGSFPNSNSDYICIQHFFFCSCRRTRKSVAILLVFLRPFFFILPDFYSLHNLSDFKVPPLVLSGFYNLREFTTGMTVNISKIYIKATIAIYLIHPKRMCLSDMISFFLQIAKCMYKLAN